MSYFLCTTFCFVDNILLMNWNIYSFLLFYKIFQKQSTVTVKWMFLVFCSKLLHITRIKHQFKAIVYYCDHSITSLSCYEYLENWTEETGDITYWFQICRHWYQVPSEVKIPSWKPWSSIQKRWCSDGRLNTIWNSTKGLLIPTL